MKNVRIWVILILLAIATPIAIHYGAWSLGVPAVRQSAAVSRTGNSAQSAEKNPDTQSGTRPEAAAHSQPSNSEVSNSSFDLPGASSSLPLLSVIGFGIFLGGLISALRTRPAHK